MESRQGTPGNQVPDEQQQKDDADAGTDLEQ
jgi:hypothetical protein